MCEFEYRQLRGFIKKLDGVGGESSATGESSISIASVVDFLIDSNHDLESIRNYTLNQVGLFIKAASDRKERERKETIVAHWIGVNYDNKQMNDLISKKKLFSDASSKSKNTDSEFARLARDMRGLK